LNPSYTKVCQWQYEGFSEPDNGIYAALNKGIARATADVVGLLHSDDFLPPIPC
jgi:glycosyltransferase involved in cell wall biosynthesis